jgi:DNA repair exonuclease SbcCD ATPase subunit
MSEIPTQTYVNVDIQNIGGIDHTTVSLPEGVSVLTGRNATNRTSFLSGIMAGLGSERSALKGDADEGSVTLQIGDDTYTRTLTRNGSSVVFSGDPFLDDPTLGDLFAFLLEDNEARRAVARGDDLREIIMRPVDTNRINAKIEECKRERNDIEARIEELDKLKQELIDLEEDREETETELEEAREKLEVKRAELESLDANVEESKSQKQELETAFERVRDARSKLEDLEFDLETEQSTIDQLEAEREELEAKLEEMDAVAENPDRLAGRIQELRERKQSLDGTVNDLGSVINFNQEMLDGNEIGITETADPTDALVADDQTTCWTCGSEVDTSQIEDTLDQLRELRSTKLDERSEIRAEIDEATDKQSTIREQKQERERIERRLDEIATEVTAAQERVADLEDQIDQQQETIAELESEAEAIDIDSHDETLKLHREINGIELRVDRLESDLNDIDEKIADHEAAIAERDKLAEERDELVEQLTDLRTRVDQIEQDAVDAFNDHMETVLDILEYDNLDRVWIERRETEVREGRRKVTKTRFDLHIIRSGSDGSAYEDTIEHLSESEREVTGLVFALAGYLVHDVSETVPFILLDSLEAIDSARIARVVEYFSRHADCLVTALLPEDAEALPDEYAYVETID